MDEIELSSLWTVAAVVLGFQLAALAWRFGREVAMEATGERTWLTAPDLIVMLSLSILVGGVFAAPILGYSDSDNAAEWFGLSLVVFASSPFVLAGHYELYWEGLRSLDGFWRKSEGRARVTAQEVLSMAVPVITSGIYIWLWVK